MLTGVSRQNITIKLVLFTLLLLIDVLASSFVEASFQLKLSSRPDVNTYVIEPIQLVILLSLTIMVLIMMWQTFLLRHGLLGILLKEFILQLGVVVVCTLISLGERIIRLIKILDPLAGYTQIQFWDDSLYQAFYYMRYFTYPLFYGALLDLSFRLSRPEYYRANKWLK